jgi:hypothetical protein
VVDTITTAQRLIEACGNSEVAIQIEHFDIGDHQVGTDFSTPLDQLRPVCAVATTSAASADNRNRSLKFQSLAVEHRKTCAHHPKRQSIRSIGPALQAGRFYRRCSNSRRVCSLMK